MNKLVQEFRKSHSKIDYGRIFFNTRKQNKTTRTRTDKENQELMLLKN